MRGTNEQVTLHLLGELLIPDMYVLLYITSRPLATLRIERCLGNLVMIKFSIRTMRLWCTAHLPYLISFLKPHEVDTAGTTTMHCHIVRCNP